MTYILMLPHHLPLNDFNESNENDTQITERNRPGFLRRTIWSEIKDIARKGQDHCRTTVRTDWDSESDALPMGSRGSVHCESTDTSCCRRFENQGFSACGRQIKNIFENFYHLVEKTLDIILPFGRIESVTMQVPGSTHRIRLTTGRPVPLARSL